MLLTFIHENGGDRERVERLCEYERDMGRDRGSCVFGLFNCFKRRIRTMSSHLETCPLSPNLPFYVSLSASRTCCCFFPFFYLPLPSRIKKWHSEIPLQIFLRQVVLGAYVACSPVFDPFPPLLAVWCTHRPSRGGGQTLFPYVTQKFFNSVKLHAKST